MTTKVDQIYYAHAGKIPLARKVSMVARRQIYRFFIESMAPRPDSKILDVGTSDETGIESNMLQQLYPHREMITCAGLSEGTEVMSAYPGVKYRKIRAHEPLPFSDNEFDIVHSNAVIEHCGSRSDQQFFLSELCRVAKNRFIIAPNPYFPIEHHTGLPLVHYIPTGLFRKLLSQTRWSFWAEEENLNYISVSEACEIWPDGKPRHKYAGIGSNVFASNFILYQLSIAD